MPTAQCDARHEMAEKSVAQFRIRNRTIKAVHGCATLPIAYYPASNQTSIAIRPYMTFVGAEWFAVRVGEHNVAIDYAIPALDHFARERALRCPNLKRHLMNVGHTMPRFGY